MKRKVHRFHRLHAQYNRYRRKLERINQGLSRYTRKDLLIARLQKLYLQLMQMKERYRMASIKVAVSAGMVVGGIAMASGQSLTLKSDNPLQLAHEEAGLTKLAFVDFDGDGDTDMFVGGKVNTQTDSSSQNIHYFRNDDGALNQQTSPFPADLMTPGVLADTARLSPGFIDLDSDGDQDAFVGLSDGTLRYYRNDDGTMSLVEGAENPFDGVKVGDSGNANPIFVDVDGDGDLDAVIGKYSGQIAYYKNEAGAFVEQTNGATDPNPFADINVSESAAPALVDFDGDGDLDLFVGNKDGEIAYFDNVEGVYTAVDAGNNPFSDIILGYNSAPAFADVDGDGDMDLFAADGNGDITYFRNDEATFSIISRNTIGIEYTDASLSHAFVDIDGDNDQDIVAGGFDGELVTLLNDAGQFTEATSNPLDTSVIKVEYISTPSFADIDGDGDMDGFVGSASLYGNPPITYLQNEGGAFSKLEGTGDPFDGVDAGANENISFVDFDGDGDLDAFIGNKDGEVKYFTNTDGVFSEAAIENPFEDISFKVDGWVNFPVSPAFADIDADGDMDGYFGLIDGNIRVFENMGDAGFTELTGADNPFDGMDFGRSASPAFGDIDGDGDMDLLVTNAAGLTFHFENGAGSVASNDFQFNQETKLYPNPTSDLVTLEIPWTEQSHATVRIFSVSGRLIDQIQTNGTKVDMNLSPLPTGMYLLKITGNSGQALKKVWKQ